MGADMDGIARRTVLLGVGAGAFAAPWVARPAWAASDAATIGWPSDVPSWDPNQRFVPDAQSIFKAVFDQPLDQDPKLNLVPSLISKWELSPDAKSLALEFRDDATFHDGSKFTSADFKWTFFDRIKAGHKIDTANIWKRVTDLQAPSPTHATMQFDGPFPTAPAWLAFLGSFVVPKDYMEKVGQDGFAAKPIGTGPFKLAEYELNSRIVLERNDAYWGPKPKLARVTIQIVKDPSARVAAVQSGDVDLTVSVPVREVTRLKGQAGLAGEFVPITRVILLQCRDDLGFSDPNVRLAAHHAIDKKALSQAFYAGAAVPLSMPVTPGGPGYVPSFDFPYDPELSKSLLAKAGFSADKPAKIGMATTNGQFPSDYDIARAIAQMWKKVGIEADVQVIEYSKYFELNRGGKLPETTLYSFDNATNDPEIFAFTLNPKLPFTPWKGMEIGQKVLDMMAVTDASKRTAGWQAVFKDAVEAGASIPLLQSVQTLVRKSALGFTPYGNGWVLPQTMSWS
jgi:peptide/nickel transport system substrate-binding protein